MNEYYYQKACEVFILKQDLISFANITLGMIIQLTSRLIWDFMGSIVLTTTIYALEK